METSTVAQSLGSDRHDNQLEEKEPISTKSILFWVVIAVVCVAAFMLYFALNGPTLPA